MLSNTYPLVTVITPTYNRAGYLAETIDSVLAQDYPAIEYIVLDDGSKDETEAVIEKYKKRLYFEAHPNMGEARTVNKGLAIAKGEFVVIVNSDDPIRPGLIRKSIELMQANSDVLVVYPDWLMIDEHSNVLLQRSVPEYDYIKMLRWHYCTPGPGAVIRRRAIELEQGRDPKYKYVADFEFWLRVGLHGSFQRLPERLATWRYHSGGISVSEGNLVQAQEAIQLIEQYYQRRNLPDKVLSIRLAALSMAYYTAGAQSVHVDFQLARQHFLKSIRLSPIDLDKELSYPGRSWHTMLSTLLLPRKLYNYTYSLWRKAKFRKSQINLN